MSERESVVSAEELVVSGNGLVVSGKEFVCAGQGDCGVTYRLHLCKLLLE